MLGDMNATNVVHQNRETALEVSRKDNPVVLSSEALYLFITMVQRHLFAPKFCLLISRQTVVAEEALAVTGVVSEVEEAVSEVETVVATVVEVTVVAMVVDTRWEEGKLVTIYVLKQG